MRRNRRLVVGVLLLVGAVLYGAGVATGVAASLAAARSPALEVGFSPDGSCHELVADLLAGAKRSIQVQAYGLSNRTVIGLLVAAARRGVTVEILIDKTEAARDVGGKRAAWRDIEDAGGHVFVDAAHPIAHNKVLVVDGEHVETGSFNYTAQAEKNAENCVVSHRPEDVRRFADNWARHRAHAEPTR